MAEKIVSPGVFTRENDLSFLPAGIGEIGAALVGPTVKGPAGIPTVVTSYAQYVEKFGDTFQSGSDYYQYLTSHTAERYLQFGGVLTVVRITGDSPLVATASVETLTPTTPLNPATGSLTFANSFFRDEGDELQITVGSTEYRFIAGETGALPLDNASAGIFFVGTGSDDATAIDALVAKIGANDALSIGIKAIDGVSFLGLSASDAGTSGNSITVQTGSGTTIETTTLTLAGGSTTTGTAGTALKFHSLAHGSLLNSIDTGGAMTEGAKNTLTNGTKDNFRWEITGVNNKIGTFNVNIRRGNDTSNGKVLLEQFNGVNLDPNSSNYVGKAIGDAYLTTAGTPSDPYIQSNGAYDAKSNYVRVEVLNQTVNYLDENGTIRVAAASASLPAAGSGSLGGAFGGGSDGSTVAGAKLFYDKITNLNSQGLDANDLLNANGGAKYTEALNLLANQDFYDINMIIVPGVNQKDHTAVVNKAIAVCEARGDAIAIVDPVRYQTTSLTTVTDQADAYNSSYAAMYWPWVQITDNQLGKNIWVPPSVVMPGVMAYNDTVAAEWYAPAGLNRGGITAIKAERNLTHTDRDTLYEGRINPIATFPGVGVCAWGQKTLQKRASALDRINVRRLLINLKKYIASTSKYLVFEQNTVATRNRFLSTVVPYMEEVQANQGLYAFKVVMDTTNNTPEVIDRNILKGDIFLQPAKAAEFIVIDFNVMPTGATFAD